VQYTEFEWQVLKTEHFEIYYYPEMTELAQRGAAFAEESYKLLEQKFNHNVLHPIPLIFYSSHLHFQQTNTIAGFIPEGVGGFFEFIKGRVVIPSNGSTTEFQHVIQHELVHVFMHNKTNRVLIDHRIQQDREPPLWFTEGLAEYWSSDWDMQAEMVLRDAVMNNYIVPLSEMDRIYGSFLMYKEGQNICQFITERFGEEKLLLLMENFWKSNSFSDVMRLTIGKDYKDFDDIWLYALKKRYYPLMSTEDMPSGSTKNLVDEGFNAKPVLYKCNGRRELYYIGNHNGYTNIYRVDADSEKAKSQVVVEGERTDEFEAFHFFQSKIAISKDGILAFVTKSGETDALHLYDVHIDEFKETIRFKNLVMIGSPSWSPDGRRIAFSSIDKSGNNDLYVLDLQSRELLRLTNDFYDDRDPAWSPDGKTIAFSSDRTPFGNKGRYNLFLYYLSNSKIEYLTFGDNDYLSPAWSQDGSMLAFTSDHDGAQNIWVMKMESDKRIMKRITSVVTAIYDPYWGDNDDLFFTAFEKFSFQIKRIENVTALIDTSNTSWTFDFKGTGEHWSVKALEGPAVVGRYSYTKDYTLDIAQSQVSTDPIFGTAGGAALAMSDVLGNDQYYFLIYNTAQVQSEILESFNVAITHISLGRRANYAYGIFRFAGNRYDLTDPDLFYYERSFGGYFVLSYPLSKFERIESGVTVSNSEKDIYISAQPRRALLFSNSLSFIWDNSLWGPSGPLDGNRLKMELAYTNDVQYSNVSYYTVIADYRKYFRLGNLSAIASRVHIWYNEGKEARRFFMGGSWDLRGWPRWSIRGTKQWLTSHELRFPFVDQLVIRFPFGGIGFGPFRGAFFTDFGGSWDDVYQDTKGSIGIGIRWNLGGVIVFRYDIGKRLENDLHTIQKGWFYQFFFGWDF
jgi:hypothetical protein